jgi:hypothetical protein
MFEIYANLILPRGGTMNKIAHLSCSLFCLGWECAVSLPTKH